MHERRLKILCVFAENQYGVAGRAKSIEYCAFIPAFNQLGHEVFFFDSWNTTLFKDYRDLNFQLLEQVRRLAPDVMFTVQRDYELWIETLETIRSEANISTVTWTTDDTWKYREVSRFIGSSYDVITTTCESRLPDYKRDGIQTVFLTQWAANSNWLNAPRPASDCLYGVTFIGSAYGRRTDQIESLRQRGVAIQTFGHGWPSGEVSVARIPEIINNSRVCLNFSEGSRKYGPHKQIKARVFEVPGAGGFLLTEKAYGMERYYEPGREMETFESVDELVEKIRYYVAHGDRRDEIAQAGFNRTKREHTYDKRLADILEFTAAVKARGQPRSTRSLSDFAASAQSYRLPIWLRFLRCLVLCVTKTFWDSQKASRAARRITFEISWRLLGRWTFTASGLPGRMFPRP